MSVESYRYNLNQYVAGGGKLLIEGGEIVLHDEEGGRDLLQLSESEMERVRGSQISMIFQEPMTSLNPVYTAGEQIAETLVKDDLRGNT